MNAPSLPVAVNTNGEMTADTTVDKAGKGHWDDIWSSADPLPRAINPRAPGASHFVNRALDAFFRRTLASPTLASPSKHAPSRTLLEIGCARSVWLPYFAREFGFRVAGLDYSEIGCRQARQILQQEQVDGQIVCADLFAPPDDLRNAFDVVVSFGVAEHFEDTAACLRAFAQFLRPGGMLLTTIPNMAGWIGSIQKCVNPPVYETHVPLDRDALADAHRRAGLEVASCEYLLFANLGAVNIENWRGTRRYHIANELRFRMGQVLAAFEKATPLLRPNRHTSPYVACVAKRPCA